MNFMPAVQKITADAEAFYDEEEFSSPSIDDLVRSKWTNALLWFDVQEVSTARVLGTADLWAIRASDQFSEAILRAETTLRTLETIVFATHSDEPASLPQDNDATETEAQMRLPIATSFAPSEELIQSWKINASSYLEKEVIASAKLNEASAEFSWMLKRLIGSFAQEARSTGLRSVVVADRQGDFQPTLQLEISERFLLLPQKSTAFFSLLHRDLLACGNENIFSGGWGKFARAPDGSLLIELNPQNLVKREGFVKAQETRK